MQQACLRRLRKEASTIQYPSEIIVLKPINDSNLMRWKAIIQGPPGSYYDGYHFELEIIISTEYPLTPPTIRFKTRIFHPNVLFENGEICLDILKKEWTPAWSLQSACLAIIAILGEPAHDSPLNCDAGNMLREGDTRAYRTMVKMYCKEFCENSEIVSS
eukprot:gene9857-13260_t